MSAESNSKFEENVITALDDDEDIFSAAPPEDLSDEEVVVNNKKTVPYRKIPEKTNAGRLQMRVPDAPDNLIDLVYRKKCVECDAILNTISSALMHYNSTKHQQKLAFLFLPNGTYNLPLSKEEIREIETGIVKTGEPNSIAQSKAKNVPFRDLLKKFDIKEDVRKLDMEFCRLCETPFSSKVAALQHYSGKKHKKNAENWSPYNPAKPIDTKDELRCEFCNVIVGSYDQMETHMTGKKHHIRMKAYLERVNAGAIAPPMSSRGFCDFNNVEREEANPVDPARFVEESFVPKNPTGSFLNRIEPEPQPSYEEPFNERDFGFRRPFGFDSSYRGDSAGGAAIGMGAAMYGGASDYYDHSVGGVEPKNYGMIDEPFGQSGMPPPPWATSISRSQMNAPYAPAFARPGGKFPVTSFGPTKFKYNRKV